MATATKLLPEDAQRSVSFAWDRYATLQALLIGALTIALYGWTLADLANDWWTDPALSQGLLIPPLAVWIAWMRRDVTLAAPADPDNRGLIWIAFACLLFLLGKLGAEFFMARISFV